MTEAHHKEASLPIDERVADLLGRMTPEEKLAQLGSIWSYEVLDNQRFDVAKARERLGNGMGQITRVAGATNLGARDVARLANEIQRFLVEETRLGIPAIVHEECLHGLLSTDSVCFPQSLGQAASWQPELAEAMAARLGRELRAQGCQQALAPIFDITRDPRWGRMEETYGEDPYLVAAMGAAYTRGLQGDGSPTDLVFATGKHMVGHGLPEGGMNHAPAHIGPRELHDQFLFPFEAAVREAGLRSMMHAYDEVDGVPCVSSKELFTTILRDRWGFDGIVVSDYAGIDELVTAHGLVPDMGAAGAMALEAGIDVELPTISAYGAPLVEALAKGLLDPAVVDRSVARVLRAKFELGLFEQPYVDPEGAGPTFEEDRALAREIARRSIVLLANDGTLPLRPDVARLAVVGPNADSARNLLGDYAHVVHIEALLDSNGFGTGLGAPSGLTVADELAGHDTILGAIRRTVLSGTEVRYAEGCPLTGGDDEGIQRAVEAATGVDVAIVVVGERSGLTDDAISGEARDRLELGLPGRQQELVEAVAATGTPVVLVLVSGRPLAIGAAAAVSAAVAHAWVPGEEGPAAVAEVLFGQTNPGGKLPVTVPRHVGQVPIFYGHKPSGGHSNWKQSYVEGPETPLWAFGFGLSYSRFELDGPRLDRTTAGAYDEVAVTVGVRNVGEREGDEVVQLYVRDREASVTRPVKQLCGFMRLRLGAGERREVTFTLAAEQLAFTGRDGRLVVEPGHVEVMVGNASDAISGTAELEITGEPVYLPSRRRFFTPVSVR